MIFYNTLIDFNIFFINSNLMEKTWAYYNAHVLEKTKFNNIKKKNTFFNIINNYYKLSKIIINCTTKQSMKRKFIFFFSLIMLEEFANQKSLINKSKEAISNFDLKKNEKIALQSIYFHLVIFFY